MFFQATMLLFVVSAVLFLSSPAQPRRAPLAIASRSRGSPPGHTPPRHPCLSAERELSQHALQAKRTEIACEKHSHEAHNDEEQLVVGAGAQLAEAGAAAAGVVRAPMGQEVVINLLSASARSNSLNMQLAPGPTRQPSRTRCTRCSGCARSAAWAPSEVA